MHKCHRRCGRSNLWAWFFIIIGGYFLAEQYNLIPSNFGFPWPLFIIAIGIYWLVGSKRKGNCPECDQKNS